mmetsp:Transcript_101208/g.179746  ORF Transcript_101208/g.179746 Transcript_101208/m.179746 type:complete len:735 (+) Transcript_101208:99-2303(+)
MSAALALLQGREQRQLQRSGSCPALLCKLLKDADCVGPQSGLKLADWEVRSLLGNCNIDVEQLAPIDSQLRQVPASNLPRKRGLLAASRSTSKRWAQHESFPAQAWRLQGDVSRGPPLHLTTAAEFGLQRKPRAELAISSTWHPLGSEKWRQASTSSPSRNRGHALEGSFNASSTIGATTPHLSTVKWKVEEKAEEDDKSPSAGSAAASSRVSTPTEAQSPSPNSTSRLRQKRLLERQTLASPKSMETIFAATDSPQFAVNSRSWLTRKLTDADAEKIAAGERAVKVAVIGAGPVGLWVALLLARKHAQLFSTTAGFRISRPPLAPTVTVFERRSEGAWGSRKVVLAMSPASQDLLNSHCLSGRENFAQHVFSPACSINFIESKLREEFEKYTAAGFGSIQLGEGVEEPEDLIEEHDVVFVATGRHWPGEEWRRGRGLQVSVGKEEEAVILKFILEPNPELGKILNEVRGHLGRFDAPGQPTYVLRPGPCEEQGWLWILGLTPEMIARVRRAMDDFRLQQEVRKEEEEAKLSGTQPEEASQQGSSAKMELPGEGFTFSSFRALWTGLTRNSVPSSSPRKSGRKVTGLEAALAYLDKQLRPSSVAPRVVVASYWHSEEVVHRVERPDGSFGWIVLVGDAACGKPFYLGSNLNGHFQDAMAILSAPWMRWANAQQEAAHYKDEVHSKRDALPEGLLPFRKYMEQYRRRIDGIGFRSGAVQETHRGKKHDKHSSAAE